MAITIPDFSKSEKINIPKFDDEEEIKIPDLKSDVLQGSVIDGNKFQDFTKKSLNEWLIPNGYLLFVHPPGWRKPNTERGKFTKMFDLMAKQNQIAEQFI